MPAFSAITLEHPRLRVTRWSEMDRWDPISFHEMDWQWPAEVMQPIGSFLTHRKEKVKREEADFANLLPVTIHFNGRMSKRNVEGKNYTMELFRAYPGDVVVAKIDLKNGAVALVPEGWENVVVTNHFAVYEVDDTRVLPNYFLRLIQFKPFKELLWRKKVGAEGRMEVKLDLFLSLLVPVPSLAVQQAILDADVAGQEQAEILQSEGKDLVKNQRKNWLDTLSMIEMLPLSTQKALPITFAELSIWSVKSIRYMLRAKAMFAAIPSTSYLLRRGEEVFDSVKNGCSGGPSSNPTTLQVLKLSAVTKGTLHLEYCKYISDLPAYREQFLLQAGDVLVCRTNGNLGMVGMSALVPTDVPNMIYPDKLIRVRVKPDQLLPAFLWRLLQLPLLRAQLEAAARTAVGNYAIGGADLWDIQLPVPPLEIQQALIDSDEARTADAARLHQQANELAAETTARVDAMILGTA